jgi:protein involved in polysaccharide export with SLBB domain
MKINKLSLLKAVVFFVLIIFASSAVAQQKNLNGGQLNISQLSDQQIIQVWQQAQKAGMSESEAMSSLVKQGLSPNDVNTFKRRLIQIQSASKSKFTSQNLVKDSSDFIKDSSWVISVPQVKKSGNYYGYDFFSNPNANFEPNIRIATPKNFILGPDDVLSISLTGLNERNIDALIDAQGNTQLPYAGIISLSGLTIEQAAERIKLKLKKVYPAINSGTTQVNISLSNVKSIRVSIIGEATRPGDYTISSLASFFNVLYLSGGPSQNGSLRKIEIIRNNKVAATVDFYSFLQNGILSKEIRLQDQDVIRFPIYNKRVFISGEVKRPAIYELVEKETLTDLIKYAGGLGDSPANNPAKVIQIGDHERLLKDVAVSDFNNYIPKNADSVFIDKVSLSFSNKIAINGAVYNPGSYEQNNGITVGELIKKAGGIINNTTISKGIIKRSRFGEEKEMISFVVSDIVGKKIADIALIANDSVLIVSKDSLRDNPLISIAGLVRKPGDYVFHRGMTIEDLIVLAGGFNTNADNNKVQISRLQKNRADTLANQLENIITVGVDTNYKTENSITLEPFDYILIPELLNYHILGSVKVRGEVLYPGDYRLEKRNATVQDILKSAGGISPFAKLSDVQVFRNNLRVATTLLTETPNSNNQFLLQPEDSIYIPKNTPFVQVLGAVFNPQILNYEGGRLYSYVMEAGGATDKAYLKKAYVQYSNGINKKIRHFLFVRFYPKVLPGSKIIVPERSPSDRRTLSIGELSAIAGVVTSLVTLAISLKL